MDAVKSTIKIFGLHVSFILSTYERFGLAFLLKSAAK